MGLKAKTLILVIPYVLLVLFGVFQHFSSVAQLNRIEDAYEDQVGILKQEQENVWSKIEKSNKNLDDKLTKFGKQLIKKSDVKAIIHSEFKIKDIKTSGDVVVSGTESDYVIHYSTEIDDFIVVESFVFLPEKRYDLKLTFKPMTITGYLIKLDGTDNLYKGIIETDSKLLQVLDFNFVFNPEKKTFWEKLDFSLLGAYQRKDGVRPGFSIGYHNFGMGTIRMSSSKEHIYFGYYRLWLKKWW